jgi:hypothetical protein
MTRLTCNLYTEENVVSALIILATTEDQYLPQCLEI